MWKWQIEVCHCSVPTVESEHWGNIKVSSNLSACCRILSCFPLLSLYGFIFVFQQNFVKWTNIYEIFLMILLSVYFLEVINTTWQSYVNSSDLLTQSIMVWQYDQLSSMFCSSSFVFLQWILWRSSWRVKNLLENQTKGIHFLTKSCK